MSGGRFNYNQFQIEEITRGVEDELNKMGKEIPRKDQWRDANMLREYPEDRYYPIHKPETVREFKEAVRILKLAYIYTQRIDWFLSGDDGEDTFHERLKEDLGKL